MSVSIGIPAYNEAHNIGLLLETLSRQKLSNDFKLREIVVVASGCTDGTENIVEKSMKLDPKLKLIVESERRGKASAVNILLRECDTDILVLEAADTLPHEKSLSNLVFPFRDQRVGAAGGRPVPVNPEDTVLGWIPHMIWGLHHHIAKAEDIEGRYFHISGEFCAIRTGIIRTIPLTIVNDDAYIGLVTMRAGCDVVYVPSATVSMKGPSSIRDIISQRRRVVYGHQQLVRNYGADIASIKSSQIIKALPKTLSFHPKKFLGTIIGVGFEALSHVLASMDTKKRRLQYIWQRVPSTKSLILN
nr:glycosyltransferase [Candidatus Njordarchaeum guaymaensis]